ncbi:MAG TPA: hypothetical protein VJ249_08990 [Candidatus Bathyarchaeia archaeon]|nr:hypothetical protein [Candidatus Bathyarchaeia archaeon]
MLVVMTPVRSRKRVSWILIVLVFAVNAFILAVALPLHPIWAYMVVSFVVALDFSLYFLYVRYYKKENVRYPLVPPEGKGDVYFPRSKIPRPIHEDMRRMREKEREFAKLRKLRRRKK